MKHYNIKYGVGKAKYVVSYHSGEKFHKDGSKFFDISIFRAKKELNKFVKQLISEGYVN